LSQIKFPSEFSNNQNLLSQRSNFKASDYRNFIYYVGAPILYGILKPKYYNHFLLYVTAIRILTQDCLEANEISQAAILMNHFVRMFSALYGQENMTFNLHAHTHLAAQASMYGPLHKLTCFAFEGLFSVLKTRIHGTRGYANQIYEYIALEKIVDSEKQIIINGSIDCNLIPLFENYDKLNEQKKIIKKVSFNNLNQLEKNFFQTLVNNETRKEFVFKSKIKFKNNSKYEF